jgi:histidinol phosphatase-like enzyme
VNTARFPDAEVMLCRHAAGPPVCWCRPPLPGLVVAFLEKHGVDPEQSVMLCGSSAHEAIARALGIRVR